MLRVSWAVKVVPLRVKTTSCIWFWTVNLADVQAAEVRVAGATTL